MSKKHIVGIIMAGLFFVPSLSVAQSPTREDLARQINALLQMIQSLQAQLAVQTGGGGTIQPTPINPNQCTLTFNRNLAFGISEFDEVTKLQRFLTDEGFYEEKNIIGIFGSKTKSAVKKWQIANGVITANTKEEQGAGSVGPKTKAAINAKCGLSTPIVIPTPSVPTPVVVAPPSIPPVLSPIVVPLPTTPLSPVTHVITNNPDVFILEDDGTLISDNVDDYLEVNVNLEGVARKFYSLSSGRKDYNFLAVFTTTNADSTRKGFYLSIKEGALGDPFDRPGRVGVAWKDAINKDEALLGIYTMTNIYSQYIQSPHALKSGVRTLYMKQHINGELA